MFYESQTLIVVYKDEMLANQMKKLIETKDDVEGSVTGTRDNSINVVTWTEKVWLANKKAGNITSKVLFLGDIKGVDALIPVIDVKFEKHGCRAVAGRKQSTMVSGALRYRIQRRPNRNGCSVSGR